MKRKLYISANPICLKLLKQTLSVATILTLIFLASCSIKENVTSIPSHLIPRDTMVKLLVDIHLADAYLSQNRLPKEIGGRDIFYTGLPKKYGYDRALFDSTIRFLSMQSKIYQDIYEDVLNELSLLQAQVEKEKSLQAENEDDNETFIYDKKINDESNESYENDEDSIAQLRLKEAQERYKKLREKQDKKVKE